jgi:hypothetical protein
VYQLRITLATVILAVFVMPVSFAVDSIIEIPNSPGNQRILRELDLDYDCMGGSEKSLHFLLDDKARKNLSEQSFLKTKLFSHSRTAVEDVHAQFANVIDKPDLGIYHTFKEMKEELEATALKHPSLTTLTVGAKTYQDRPIYVLEITAKESKQEKLNFLVTGSHHAREWISTEVPLAFIEHLVEGYGKDELVTKLLDTSVIVVVPMLNADGGVHSRNVQTMWRKNMRRPKRKWFTGVDNNRNYPYKFGGSGASNSSISEVYHGPKALSEVENQLIIQLTEQYSFKSAVSFHSFSELILWPWGYTDRIQSKDHDIFKHYGSEMGRIMGYKPIQASRLYPAAGVFDDTMYANYGVLAYTIELGKRFIPRERNVPWIEKMSIKALRYLFTNARNPFGNQEDTDLRKAERILERLVYHMEDPDYSASISEDHEALSRFDVDILSQAMDELKMEPELSNEILESLADHKNAKDY